MPPHATAYVEFQGGVSGTTKVHKHSEHLKKSPNGVDASYQKMYEEVKDSEMVIAALSYPDPDGTLRCVAGCYYRSVRDALPKSFTILFPTPSIAYRVGDSPGKGKGLFATRDIAVGEVIVVERPLVIFPHLFSGNLLLSPEEVMDFTFERLTKADRNTFFALSNCKGKIFNPGLGIFSTNAIGLQLKGAEDSYVGVFGVISRVNHSCGPNTKWRWDYETFSMHLHAVRPIHASTEITASYCPTEMSASDRLDELHRKYHFTCTCTHCCSPSLASDAARKELSEWAEVHLTYEQWLSNPNRDPHALIQSALKALVMIEKEGLQGTFGPLHYLDLFRCYGTLADEKRMRKWGWYFLMTYKGAYPRDEALLEGVAACMTDPPRYFKAWGRAVKKF